MHPGFVPDGKQLCIWMSAGLLTYKLCDREFECDHCPLDAALRGIPSASPRQEVLLAPNRDARVFPDDRFYTEGHSWVQVAGGPEGRRLRVGIDAFAAAIIGRCCGVSWRDLETTLSRGETVCQVDLGFGILPVRVPLRGTVAGGNESLENNPCQVVTAPYGDGWIVELLAADPTELHGLMTAEAARENMRLDLRWFRRRVATQLFQDAIGVGRSLADGGEPLPDLRQMLGGHRYLDILRELIH